MTLHDAWLVAEWVSSKLGMLCDGSAQINGWLHSERPRWNLPMDETVESSICLEGIGSEWVDANDLCISVGELDVA